MSLEAHCTAILDELHASDLIRRPRAVHGPQDHRIRVDGRDLLCFSSNNYLGLANHPELLTAARRSLEVDGLGAGASRLITGTMDAHLEAEAALAAFVRAEAALLFGTGYTANVGALQALGGPDTLVLSDALNHASLIDGARLSRSSVRVYRHIDVAHLDALLHEHRRDARNAIVVTDALFSMDGDSAPLADLRRVADAHDAWLFVDEAHAIGVLGPEGRGLCARDGVVPDVLVGTLGKSFGVAGAFVAGSARLRDLLLHRARSFVYSTAPLPLAARAATAATRLVLEADDRRRRVLDHARRLRAGLASLGLEVPSGEGPIVPVRIGDAAATMALAAKLFDAGFLCQGIRPPTVPRGTSRIRLVPMATHSEADIDALIAAFERATRTGP